MEEAHRWVKLLAAEVGVFKVGLELYTAVGPDAVRMVHDAGAACFLDLKLHDIPATMVNAVDAAAKLGVQYLTVHASAGTPALVQSQLASGDVTLLAITALTSLGAVQLKEMGFDEPPHVVVERLAGVASAAGIGGFVCSSLECGSLRKQLGQDACLVVPGIRPEGSSKDDQQRVATPTMAIQSGASLLVVGRPIRNANDPLAAAHAVVHEIEQA